MKTYILLLIAALGITGRAAADAPANSRAVIDGIRTSGTNIVITVTVPEGVRRVTLESRPRFGRGAWTPRGVRMPDAGAAEVVFTVPAGDAMMLFRATTDDDVSMPLPASFYSGLRHFAAVPSATMPSAGAVNLFSPAVPGAEDAGRGGVSAPRTVEESDIWKFSGSSLYFFNQSRGLQVFDVTAPSRPVARGRLPLALYGEQMYVLGAPAPGGDWLALLAQRECRWDATDVLVVRSSNGVPALRTSVPLPGRVVESRLVGDILLVASQGWTNTTTLVTNITFRPAGPGSMRYWETGMPLPFPADMALAVATNVFARTVGEAFTMVISLDLSDPENPAVRAVERAPASPTAIFATDGLLLVASTSTSWSPFGGPVTPTNSVLVYDISDASGAIRRTGSLETAGRVPDKFKFGLDGDVLTVVSQVDGRWTPNSGRWSAPAVALETFSLADPTAPARLARLDLVTNENVFATRYAPGRAYIVTFRQVDPLWIVDLSNPSAPAVRGELHVPGWSTYIEPLGDRLLAMGVEGGRAAVSLFDVANPAAPALVDKVFMGDGWSWSEANADEKAFRVFPDRNLALLPWHGRLGTNGWFQGIQLLDVTRDDLALRGVIDHAAVARRATLVGDTVLSISSGELLAASVTDRDRPAVTAALALSRPADRVLLAGERLVRIALPRWDGDRGFSGLTVALASPGDPDTDLDTLSLTNAPLIGAAYRDGRAYLLQRGDDGYRIEPVLATNWVVHREPVPPITRFVTNEVVQTHPVPPEEFCTNVLREVVVPPSPTSPGYVTNILFTRCEPIPRPPMLVTNLFVTRYEEWVPPLLVTNAVVVTNQNYVPVPGQTWLHVVAVSGDRLVRTGTATVRNELAGYDTYEAHWTGEGTLLWLPNASGQAWGGPFFLGDAVGLRFAPGILPWFGGGSRLLAFDVSATAAPALLSAVDLASGDFTGFNVTGVALSGSRAYASVSRSEWVPAAYQPTPENVVTRAWWDWNGSWRTSHELRVVDFTDPSEPVVRAAVPLPGELLGVSHAGNLLYARTNAFTTNGTSAGALAALAYDGVAASLVAARRLPDGSEPLLVRADGRILVGRRDASRVEIWALTDAAELETFDVLEMPTLVNRFLGFGGLVVADGDGAVAAIDLSGARVVVSGTGDRPCGLWFDPAAADATRESGLWIPRGDAGLWRISFGTP